MDYLIVAVFSMTVTAMLFTFIVMKMKHLVAVIERNGRFEVTYLGKNYELKPVDEIEFY